VLAETTQLLVDHVILALPKRQQLLPVSKRLLCFLQHDADLEGTVLHTSLSVVARSQRRHNPRLHHCPCIGMTDYIRYVG
jgi:hypothetical protein